MQLGTITTFFDKHEGLQDLVLAVYRYHYTNYNTESYCQCIDYLATPTTPMTSFPLPSLSHLRLEVEPSQFRLEAPDLVGAIRTFIRNRPQVQLHIFLVLDKVDDAGSTFPSLSKLQDEHADRVDVEQGFFSDKHWHKQYWI